MRETVRTNKLRRENNGKIKFHGVIHERFVYNFRRMIEVYEKMIEVNMSDTVDHGNTKCT